MADRDVQPAVFFDTMARLERFVVPFAARCRRRNQQGYAQTYVHGLLLDSDVDQKNAEVVT